MAGDYPNRSDLRNTATKQANFTGQTYGQAAQQTASQQAVPPGTAPSTLQGQAAAAGQGGGGPRPGGKPLGRPTERLGEPVTAGADFGPGPNSMQAGIRPRIIGEDDVLLRLREVYRLYPNEGLRMLIARYSNTVL